MASCCQGFATLYRKALRFPNEILEFPCSARLPSSVQKFQQLRPTGQEGPGCSLIHGQYMVNIRLIHGSHNRGFTKENPTKIDDLGVPLFQETIT